MSSRPGIGRASSAESSPSSSRVAARKKSPNVASKESLVLSPIATRSGYGYGGSQSALQSAWIQRIIPLPRALVSGPPEDHQELYLKSNEDGLVLPVNMECTDDEEDCQAEVSGFKFDAPSSWLTGRNSEREETQSFPEARIVGSPHQSTGSRGKAGVSCDSKVVPIAEDEGITSKFTIEKTLEEQELERQHNEFLGSSAWFTRITKKDVSRDGDSKQQQATRCFPPLKSGEQWPGTLKPSGLPPLRIPSTRGPGRLEESSLPLLTPVAVAPRPDDNGDDDTGDVKEAPSLIRTISLFDSVDASGSSFTCSLPSNFATGRNNSDRTKSLQDRFGFISGTVRKNSNASSSSETKSLFRDEEGEEIQSLSRRQQLNTVDSGGKFLSRASIESNARSNVPVDQPQDPPKYNAGRSPQRDRPPAALHSSKSVRMGQTPLPLQPGSQQWLHRWASPTAYKDGARAK